MAEIAGMKKSITGQVLVFLLFGFLCPEGWNNPRKLYELHGTLLDQSGQPLRADNATVQLTEPYGSADLSTLANLAGGFRFKKVPAGVYILTAFIPRIARTRRTIEVGPSFADGKGKIGITLRMERRPRRPGGYQVSMEQLSVPEEARAEYQKGLQRYSARDWSEASKRFRKAVDIAPQFSAAWYQLGIIACQQSRTQEGADYFQEALRHVPDHYQALINLGSVLLTQRKVTEAVTINQRAVKARPDDAQAQVQLGYSYLMAGRLEDAEIHLKRTIALDPANYYYPQLLLAEIYNQLNDHPSMVRELKEFLRLHPDSLKAHDVTQILDRLRLQLETAAESSR
jgi:tetratricopeptide (TPR) repeat protein